MHKNRGLESILNEAVTVLRTGGVVAFPTETYYGLAVDPFNTAALERLFQVKKRSFDKPVLTLIKEEQQLELLVEEIPSLFQPLMRKFWPGPLSLVFRGLHSLPPLLTCNNGTVGVRISSHPLAHQLVAAFGGPITATSANISGKSPAEHAIDVAEQLGGSIDLTLDAGKTFGGKGSTIIGQKEAHLVLIREGAISFNEIVEKSGKGI